MYDKERKYQKKDRDSKNIEISAIFRVPQMKLGTQGQKIVRERQKYTKI